MTHGSENDIVCRLSGVSANIQQLGPYGIESLITAGEEGKATAYRVRVEAKQKTSTSFHKVAEEIYYVISGYGKAYLNQAPHDLKPGVFLRLPPGTWHAFEAGPDGLDMLDIHTPGCRPDRDVYFPEGDTPEGFEKQG